MDEFCSQHSGIVSEKDNLKTEIIRLQLVIERLESRLPIWATGGISFLTFVVGLLSGWVIHLENAIKAMPK